MEPSTGVGQWWPRGSGRISLNVLLHKAAAGTLPLPLTGVFSGVHVWKQRPYSLSYPASSPFQPGHQGLADELSQAVNDGVHHGWLCVPHTVHCQPRRHRVERHHLAPRYA